MMSIKRIPRFVYALSLALVVAIAMTCLSVSIYTHSDVSNIDLSRPGYESIRGEIKPVDNSTTFSSTGALTGSTINEFKKLYKPQSDSLRSADNFTNNALGNDTLGMPIDQDPQPQY